MYLNRRGREKVKTAILVLLLAASFVQIGILLGDQSRSLPFNFILGIFRSASTEVLASDNAAREELFTPFRMIATDGNEEHWYINKQDQYYENLWRNAKQVLKSIAGKTPSSANPNTDWGSIVSKKGFVFEFKANLTGKLLSWSLGITGDMPEAQKIMIIPDVDDEAKLEVYICSLQDNNTYKTLKYVISRKLWSLSAEADNGIYTDLSENEKYTNSSFNLVNETDLAGSLPDVPIFYLPPKYRPYSEIYPEKPVQVRNIGGINADENLAETILGSRIVSYNRESFTDLAQFKNSDSIYTINRNGLLEYKYISARNDTKDDDIASALMNAYRFMSNIRRINETKATTLYLSSVEPNKAGGYIFTFDYTIDGMPIYYNLTLDNGLTRINNAVKIVADSENVISCEWMLQDFRMASHSNEYNVYFLNLADSASVGNALKNVFIKNINIGYVVNSESDLQIEPSMIVEKAAGEKEESGILDIKMPKKGD